MLLQSFLLPSLATAGKTWYDIGQQLFKSGFNESIHDPLQNADFRNFVHQIMEDFHTP